MGYGVIEYRVATADERRAALELALRSVGPETRAAVVEAVSQHEPEALGPLDALVVADRGGDLIGALWIQPSPGQAAALWPIEARGVGLDAVAEGLLREALRRVDACGVAMTQALLDSDDDPRVGTLARAGFQRIADLRYLGRSLRSADALRSDPEGVAVETYEPTQYDRLKRVLNQTYEGSLDCPAIEGRRALDDILTGYRATGRHDPRDWFFVTAVDDAGEPRDAGVLLLTDHAAAQQYELVYMGLARSARGRGIGHAVVGEAIRVAARRGAERLMVAVDAQNTPARKVYEKAGFAEWGQKFVYVR